MLQSIGRALLSFFQKAGHFSLFALTAISHIVRPPFYAPTVGRLFLDIGFYSLPVVGLTAAFSGMVLALQSYSGFSSFNSESTIAAIVALSITRELGPVMAGLMVAGRVGAAMSAEIGTMRVTQQIDALRALAVNPVDYLVVPRALAMFVSMPFLVVECVGCGILASYYVGVNVLNISGVYFLANTQKFADSSDIIMALVKGFFFAGVIVFISCREGLNAKDGAVGVGRATTSTVVNCSLAILIVNFFLTMALNVLFPAGQ